MKRRDFLAVASVAIWTPWSEAADKYVATINEDGSPLIVANAPSPLAVTLHTTTGCQPCERMKASLASDPRLDVRVETNRIPKGVPATVFPFITFEDSAGVTRYNLTVRTADAVVELIERTRRSVAGPGGARRAPTPGPALVKMSGYHTHTCRADGTRWGHPLLGRAVSHGCPKCGKLEYRKD